MARDVLALQDFETDVNVTWKNDVGGNIKGSSQSRNPW
jgi:hypothetical protein